MKRWHGVVVGVALVAIVAYVAMIVGPRYYGRRHAYQKRGGQRGMLSMDSDRSLIADVEGIHVQFATASHESKASAARAQL